MRVATDLDHLQLGASVTTLRTLGAAVALLAVGYAALFWSLDGLPYGDTPNHLTRAVVIADLLFHGGRRFAHEFTFTVGFFPYILGDLLLASMVELFGAYDAGRLWVVLTAASLPLSMIAYLRLTGHRARSALLAAIVAMYLGTDWFFMAGFGSFRIGIALTLLTCAFWQRFLRDGSIRAYAAYALLLVAGYLTHLSALVFSAAAVGTISIVALVLGEAPMTRAACGAIPFLALGAAYGLSSGLGSEPAVWRLPILKKIVRLASPFQRYGVATEGALALLFAIICAFMAKGWRDRRRSARVVTEGVLAIAFLGVYVALPHRKGIITYVDVRAIPFVAITAFLWALAVWEERASRSRVVPILAIALAGANLLVLAIHLLPANADMLQYRELAKRIPRGSVVLPVVTNRPADGRSEPLNSAGTFATIEVGALTPYIFEGGAQPYFRARALPYAPGEYWARWNSDPGDTATIARTYDYVLAMTPFDPSRLRIPTREIARNRAAVLLQVVH